MRDGEGWWGMVRNGDNNDNDDDNDYGCDEDDSYHNNGENSYDYD